MSSSRTILLSLPFLVATVLGAPRSVTADTVAGTCPVKGTVVDDSGLPMPGVVLTLRPTQPATPPEDLVVITTETGGFTFCPTHGGPSELQASIAGFRQRERVVFTTAPSTIQLVLSPILTEEVVVTGTRTRVAVSDAPIRTEAVPTRVIEHTGCTNTVAEGIASTGPKSRPRSQSGSRRTG